MPFISSAETDRGQRRKANEDSILPPIVVPRPGEDEWVYCAVADGVGGAVGGAVASSTAIARFRERFAAGEGDDPAQRMSRAMVAANEAIVQRANAQPDLQGMATTLVAAVACGMRIWFCNIGDSRGYLLQSGVFCQVTSDHSLISDAVKAGLVTPEDAVTRPERHVINRSLGTSTTVEPECFGPLRFQKGDIALLCSDGLHDVVAEEVVVDALQRLSADRAAPELVRLANENGGPDNITVIVLTAT